MLKKEMLIVISCIMIISVISLVSAEKLSIQIGKLQGDIISFKITLYDDNNNKINGEVNYIIEDYYTDKAGEGKVDSGEEINFKLPKNPVQGPWRISASYRDKSISELFNVGDIKRADIRLEKDNLIIENTGNVAYDKKLLISIGEQAQTAQVYLEVGQTKKIRLTGENKKYTVKVDDGSGENPIVFEGVSLTGNVVGLESVLDGSFWQKYPLVSIFLIALAAAIVIILGLKLSKKYSGSKNIRRKKR